MKKLKLPARTIAEVKMEFPIKNKWGYGLKIAIRNVAKTLPLYRTPVEIKPLVTGKSDKADKIPINTLGRWLFGVPGYAGHIRVMGGEDNVSVHCPDVVEVKKLITNSVEILEENHND